MTSFSFATTRALVCEPGAATKLGAQAQALGITRVLIVTDQGIVKAGLLQTALDSLAAAGVATAIYADVVADPPEAIVRAAVASAKDFAADGVIGFGGGSSMDTAKLVAFLAVSKQDLSEIYGIGFAKGKRLPLILVTTTAGTGSEVTPIAIVTTGETTKAGVVSDPLYPDLAVLDADLTLGLPPHVTAATGIDAMVHAIEAFTSKHKKNAMSDMLALKALELLARNIRAAVFDGADRTVRSNMLLGACLAGMAFANAPVAAVHALAYPIGGQFHVAHGLSNSLMLTHVLRFNLSVAGSLYSELAPVVTGDRSARAAAMIDWLEDLRRDLKIETQLRQVGIGPHHLPGLAEDAMKQTRLLVNNPREVRYDDALALYSQAL
jgi:alcohol dehydrogenase class IV